MASKAVIELVGLVCELCDRLEDLGEEDVDYYRQQLSEIERKIK